MKLQHCLAAIAAACLTTLAGAAPITYTFSANVAVALGDGSTEQRALSLVVQGDTTNVSFVPDMSGDYYYVDSGLAYSLTVGGTSYTFDATYGTFYLYNFVPDGIVGFGLFGAVDWWQQDVGAALASYALDSDVGPVGGTLIAPGLASLLLDGATDFQLNFSALSDVRFSSALDVQQIPEPGSFALAGLALAGLALTRRRA